MKIRSTLLALALSALALSSCKRSNAPSSEQAPKFGTYQDSDGNYRFEAPMGWRPASPEQPGAKGATSVYFRGYESVDGQNRPIDVAVLVSKLPRRPNAFSSPQDYDRFRRATLLQVDALFDPPSPDLPDTLKNLVAKNTQDITIAGLPGKTYHRDYDYIDPHAAAGSKPLPVSLEEIVLRTPEAYYVLEYRARRDLFDRYHFAAERLKSSFQPGRG